MKWLVEACLWFRWLLGIEIAGFSHGISIREGEIFSLLQWFPEFSHYIEVWSSFFFLISWGVIFYFRCACNHRTETRLARIDRLLLFFFAGSRIIFQESAGKHGISVLEQKSHRQSHLRACSVGWWKSNMLWSSGIQDFWGKFLVVIRIDVFSYTQKM